VRAGAQTHDSAGNSKSRSERVLTTVLAYGIRDSGISHQL
jgi:hypothetical protein